MLRLPDQHQLFRYRTFVKNYQQAFIAESIPKPAWAVGFAHEQTLRDATLAVFSFLILKRLQHNHCQQIKFFRHCFFVAMLILFVLSLSTSISHAQFNFNANKENDTTTPTTTATTKPAETPEIKYGPKRGTKHEQTWIAGIVLEAGSQLDDVTITLPVPTSWFEQEVKSYRCVKGKSVVPRDVNFRTINNGAKEAVLQFPKLRLNNKLEILFEFDVVNYEVEAPEDTYIYVIPKKIPSEVAPYLKASPKIEIDNNKVAAALRKVLREITNDKQTDWEKVEAIYTYTQKRVKYNDANKSLPAKGVKALLEMREDRCEGDCKDLCSLFVALCRLQKIPARLVRLPEHCYAEFYLEVSKNPIQKPKPTTDKNTENSDSQSTAALIEKLNTRPQKPTPTTKKGTVEQRGFWFPCQVAGTYSFGGIPEHQVILQKGDSFPDPENPPNGKKQFLTEVFEGSLQQGSPNPRFRFIHDVKTE
ncbi:MAG: transglutaminase domain-containing protein [Planctomycetaceae bacterium]|jgi:hypothetical protein|nr:transglutaminase domain-containing protein [Planctomycetaceae bacterium]